MDIASATDVGNVSNPGYFYGLNYPVEEPAILCLDNNDCSDDSYCSEGSCLECNPFDDSDGICCNGELAGDCSPSTEDNCQDNIDNDFDSLTDCLDEDCDWIYLSESNAYCNYDVEDLCYDNFDNDGDSLVDCDDSDCSEDAGCVEEIISPYTTEDVPYSTSAVNGELYDFEQFDWLGNDTFEDVSNNDSALDLTALYASDNSSHLFFRMTLANLSNLTHVCDGGTFPTTFADYTVYLDLNGSGGCDQFCMPDSDALIILGFNDTGVDSWGLENWNGSEFVENESATLLYNFSCNNNTIDLGISLDDLGFNESYFEFSFITSEEGPPIDDTNLFNYTFGEDHPLEPFFDDFTGTFIDLNRYSAMPMGLSVDQDDMIIMNGSGDSSMGVFITEDEIDHHSYFSASVNVSIENFTSIVGQNDTSARLVAYDLGGDAMLAGCSIDLRDYGPVLAASNGEQSEQGYVSTPVSASSGELTMYFDNSTGMTYCSFDHETLSVTNGSNLDTELRFSLMLMTQNEGSNGGGVEVNATFDDLYFNYTTEAEPEEAPSSFNFNSSHFLGSDVNDTYVGLFAHHNITSVYGADNGTHFFGRIVLNDTDSLDECGGSYPSGSEQTAYGFVFNTTPGGLDDMGEIGTDYQVTIYINETATQKSFSFWNGSEMEPTNLGDANATIVCGYGIDFMVNLSQINASEENGIGLNPFVYNFTPLMGPIDDWPANDPFYEYQYSDQEDQPLTTFMFPDLLGNDTTDDSAVYAYQNITAAYARDDGNQFFTRVVFDDLSDLDVCGGLEPQGSIYTSVGLEINTTPGGVPGGQGYEGAEFDIILVLNATSTNGPYIGEWNGSDWDSGNFNNSLDDYAVLCDMNAIDIAFDVRGLNVSPGTTIDLVYYTFNGSAPLDDWPGSNPIYTQYTTKSQEQPGGQGLYMFGPQHSLGEDLQDNATPAVANITEVLVADNGTMLFTSMKFDDLSDLSYCGGSSSAYYEWELNYTSGGCDGSEGVLDADYDIYIEFNETGGVSDIGFYIWNGSDWEYNASAAYYVNCPSNVIELGFNLSNTNFAPGQTIQTVFIASNDSYGGPTDFAPDVENGEWYDFNLTQQGPPGGNTLSGYVKYPNGTIIANVPIDLEDSFGSPLASTTTDGSGFFKFQELSENEYSLNFNDGFSSIAGHTNLEVGGFGSEDLLNITSSLELNATLFTISGGIQIESGPYYLEDNVTVNMTATNNYDGELNEWAFRNVLLSQSYSFLGVEDGLTVNLSFMESNYSLFSTYLNSTAIGMDSQVFIYSAFYKQDNSFFELSTGENLTGSNQIGFFNQLNISQQGGNQTYNLSGYLKYLNGTPINGAGVWIENNVTYDSDYQVTNASGYYEVSNLTSGGYDIELATSGVFARLSNYEIGSYESDWLIITEDVEFNASIFDGVVINVTLDQEFYSLDDWVSANITIDNYGPYNIVNWTPMLQGYVEDDDDDDAYFYESIESNITLLPGEQVNFSLSFMINSSQMADNNITEPYEIYAECNLVKQNNSLVSLSTGQDITITAEFRGEQEVNVTGGGDQNHTLSGYIKYLNGTPIDNVSVYLRHNETYEYYENNTDASGYYTINNLPFGGYRFDVESDDESIGSVSNDLDEIDSLVISENIELNASLPAGLFFNILTDKGSYALDDTAYVNITVYNYGEFDLHNWTIFTEGYAENDSNDETFFENLISEDVTILQGENISFNFSVFLNETAISSVTDAEVYISPVALKQNNSLVSISSGQDMDVAGIFWYDKQLNITEEPVCGYSGGDWNITTPINCSDEEIYVDGDITIVAGDLATTSFSAASTAAYDLRGNSTDIGENSELDLLANEAGYTDDWDQSGSGMDFYIAMNETSNRIQILVNLSPGAIYIIDLDQDASTGFVIEDGRGYDLWLGNMPDMGVYGVGVSNSTLEDEGDFGWFQNAEDGDVMNTSTSSDWNLNYTVYMNKSDDNFTIELIIDMYSTEEWADKTVFMAVFGEGDDSGYTTFMNSSLEEGGQLSLENITLEIEGNISADGTLIINNSEIEFQVIDNSTDFVCGSGSVVLINNSLIGANNSDFAFGFKSYSPSLTLQNTEFSSLIQDYDWGSEETSSGIHLEEGDALITNVTLTDFSGWNCFYVQSAGAVLSNLNTSENSCSLYLNGGGSYTVRDSHLSSLSLMNGPSNCLISNNKITYSLSVSSNGETADNIFVNNNLENARFFDISNTTNSNYLIYNNSFGEVSWYLSNLTINSSFGNTLNFSIGENVYVENNTIGLSDHSRFSNLNDSATLTFRGLFWESDTAEVCESGASCFDCNSTNNCTYNYDARVLVVNVTHFSNYTTNGTNVGPPSYTLSGYVKYLNGTPVYDIDVYLEHNFTYSEYYNTTDASGYYEIHNVPAGGYNYDVEPDNEEMGYSGVTTDFGDNEEYLEILEDIEVNASLYPDIIVTLMTNTDVYQLNATVFANVTVYNNGEYDILNWIPFSEAYIENDTYCCGELYESEGDNISLLSGQNLSYTLDVFLNSSIINQIESPEVYLESAAITLNNSLISVSTGQDLTVAGIFGAEIKINISEFGSNTLSGYARYLNGTPIDGAEVWMQNNISFISYEELTNATGYYEVTNLSGIGGYDVEIGRHRMGLAGASNWNLESDESDWLIISEDTELNSSHYSGLYINVTLNKEQYSLDSIVLVNIIIDNVGPYNLVNWTPTLYGYAEDDNTNDRYFYDVTGANLTLSSGQQFNFSFNFTINSTEMIGNGINLSEPFEVYAGCDLLKQNDSGFSVSNGQNLDQVYEFSNERLVNVTELPDLPDLPLLKFFDDFTGPTINDRYSVFNGGLNTSQNNVLIINGSPGKGGLYTNDFVDHSNHFTASAYVELINTSEIPGPYNESQLFLGFMDMNAFQMLSNCEIQIGADGSMQLEASNMGYGGNSENITSLNGTLTAHFDNETGYTHCSFEDAYANVTNGTSLDTENRFSIILIATNEDGPHYVEARYDTLNFSYPQPQGPPPEGPTYTLSGYLTFINGTPIESMGMEVQKGGQGQYQSNITNASGYYEITGLSEGNYTMYADYDLDFPGVGMIANDFEFNDWIIISEDTELNASIYGDVYFTFETDKETYSLNDTVYINVTINNSGNYDLIDMVPILEATVEENEGDRETEDLYLSMGNNITILTQGQQIVNYSFFLNSTTMGTLNTPYTVSANVLIVQNNNSLVSISNGQSFTGIVAGSEGIQMINMSEQEAPPAGGELYPFVPGDIEATDFASDNNGADAASDILEFYATDNGSMFFARFNVTDLSNLAICGGSYPEPANVTSYNIDVDNNGTGGYSGPGGLEDGDKRFGISIDDTPSITSYVLKYNGTDYVTDVISVVRYNYSCESDTIDLGMSYADLGTQEGKTVTLQPGITWQVGIELGLLDGLDSDINYTISSEAPSENISCTDFDGDGFNSSGLVGCGLQDCNDYNVSIYPGTEENCTDGVDNNCNWLVDSDDLVCGGQSYPDWSGIGFQKAPYAANGNGCHQVGEETSEGNSPGVNCPNNGDPAFDVAAVWVDQDYEFVYWKFASANITGAKFCGGTNEVRLYVEFNADDNMSTGSRNGIPNDGSYPGSDYQFKVNLDGYGEMWEYDRNGTYCNHTPDNQSCYDPINGSAGECYCFTYNSSMPVYVNITENPDGSCKHSKSEITVAVRKNTIMNITEMNFEANSFPATDVYNGGGPIDMHRGGDDFDQFFGAGQGEDPMACGQFSDNQSKCDDDGDEFFCRYNHGIQQCGPDPQNFDDCDEACFACSTENDCTNSEEGICEWDTDNPHIPEGQDGICREEIGFQDLGGSDCDNDCYGCFTENSCSNSLANGGGTGYGGCTWFVDAFNGDQFCEVFGVRMPECRNQASDSVGAWTGCTTQSACEDNGWYWDAPYRICSETSGSEICYDTIDNDGDGQTDCRDTDCYADFVCGGTIETITGDYATQNPFEVMDEFMQQGFDPAPPFVIGTDSVGETAIEYADITAISIKDGPKAIFFGTELLNVSELQMNDDMCQLNGTENIKIIDFLDIDDNETSGCNITINSQIYTGYEFTLRNDVSGGDILGSALKCINDTWRLVPIRLSSVKNAMCNTIPEVVLLVQKADIGNPTDTMEIHTVTMNTSWWNLSNLTVLDQYNEYYTPGSVDFEPIDCFAEPTRCGAFSLVGEGRSMPFEDCPEPGDYDLDGLEGCDDPDCSYLPSCSDNYNASEDNDASRVSMGTTEEFDVGASIVWSTNEPTNSSLLFFHNDSTCTEHNETLTEPLPQDFQILNPFKPWHSVMVDDYNLGYSLSTSTTYYYKLQDIDRADNVAQSKCLNFTTTSAPGIISILFNFTPTASNNVSVRINDQNITFGQVQEYNLTRDVNLTFYGPKNSSVLDNGWEITCVDADLVRAADLDLRDAMLINFSGDNNFLGMDIGLWNEITQKLGCEFIKVRIPEEGNDLLKCADNGTNCETVDDFSAELINYGGSGDTAYSLWRVNVNLGFSTYRSNQSTGDVNFTINATLFNESVDEGQDIEVQLNITNTDSRNLSIINVNGSFLAGYLDFTYSSDGMPSDYGQDGPTEWGYWDNVTDSVPLEPGQSYIINWTFNTSSGQNDIPIGALVDVIADDGNTSNVSTTVYVNVSSTYCGGAYSGSGDWTILNATTCSNENITVTGGLTISSQGDVPTTNFSTNSLSSYDARSNSSTISLSDIDLVADDTSYTDDWDDTTISEFYTRINGSEHIIQMYVDNNNLSYAYFIDVDSSSNSGVGLDKSETRGYDLFIGYFPDFNLTHVAVFNRSISPPNPEWPSGWFQNATNGMTVTADYDSGLTENYTVNFINDTSNYKYEVMINMTGAWTDKPVALFYGGPGDYPEYFTTFKNSELLDPMIGALTLNNVTLELSGNLDANANTNLTIQDSTIEFQMTDNESANLSAFDLNWLIINHSTISSNGSYYYTLEFEEIVNQKILNSNMSSMCVSSDGPQTCQLASSSNTVIYNNTFDDCGVGSLYLGGGSSNVNISYNNFLSTCSLYLTSSGADFTLEDSYFVGNTFNNGATARGCINCIIRDNNITSNGFSLSSTGSESGEPSVNCTLENNIISGSLSDYNSTGSNTLIYNNEYGQIVWSNKSNLSIGYIDGILGLIPGTTIFLENNLLGIQDRSQFTQINTTAQLSFYGLTWEGTAEVCESGASCFTCNSGNNCTYNSGTGVLTVNVTHFSNYSTNGTEPTYNMTGWVLAPNGSGRSGVSARIIHSVTSDAD
ncbi:hypothetical protein HN698_03865, partial [Candidatus Woesearchaeota archaeon]|nr:hypothetical protein [Candidatus Woesearchaeota archaeon]